MIQTADNLKSKLRLSLIVIMASTAFISSYSPRAYSKELVLKEGDSDTISCIVDDISMKKYRERCTNNFPELKNQIENAFQHWSNANANNLRETSAACQERLTVLNKDDAARLNELRNYAVNDYEKFIGKISSDLLKDARTDCELLISELTSTDSAIPNYLPNKIRAIPLTLDSVVTNLEFGPSRIPLELRLIVNNGDPGSEVLPQKIQSNYGERTDNIFVEKSPLIGGSSFISFKIRKSSNGLALVSLSTTPEGAKLLEEATSRNIGRLAAIVLNQEVLFVLKIQEKIPEEGTFSFKSPLGRAKYMKEKISAALSQSK